jgi:Uncharacterised protein family (UPF0164)
MYSRKIFASITALAMLMAVTAFAGGRKTGINGASFLKIGVGARQVALGSAATTLSGDPNMMFWNPAGISLDASKTALAFNHNEWLLTLNHDAFAATHNFPGIGTIGVGVIYIGMGDITANRDIAPIPELEPQQADKASGTVYSFYNLAANLSISRRFTDKLALGASIKLIREKIDDQSANSIAGDFGVIYNTGWNDLMLGASLSNLGGDLVYFNSDFGSPIPLIFSIGASINLAKQEHSQLVGLVDATKRQDSQQLYFGGLEWRLAQKLAVRGGYKFGFSGSKDDFNVDTTDEGVSFGGGLQLPWGGTNLHLDYAFTEFSVLNNTHRFSFSINF